VRDVLRRNTLSVLLVGLAIIALATTVLTGKTNRAVYTGCGFGFGVAGNVGYGYGYGYGYGTCPAGGGGGGGGATTPPSTTTTTVAPGTPAAPTMTDVGGNDRDETAIEASQLTFPYNGSALAVVLVRNDLFADALGGSRLASAQGGPELLTPPKSLDPETEAEIKRVLPAGGTVFILGGTDAISASVEAQVVADGFNVIRLGGPTRFETAALVAASSTQTAAAALAPSTGPILVATGLAPPDGLTACAAAAAVDGVVLLSNGAEPTPATTAYITSHPGSTVYAIGGAAAAAYPSATPVVGATRYETAVAVANRFYAGPTSVGIATGLQFPDALTGASAMGEIHGPLLLTDPNQLSPATQQYLTANMATIRSDYIFGGISAILQTVRDEITAAQS